MAVEAFLEGHEHEIFSSEEEGTDTQNIFGIGEGALVHRIFIR